MSKGKLCVCIILFFRTREHVEINRDAIFDEEEQDNDDS